MAARLGTALHGVAARRAMRPIERPRSLTHIALVQIRDAIVAGDLGLGQPLSERALSEMLHISKTPVREALARLRLEGLVRIYPQRGACVFSLSAPEVIEICELRHALEAAALRFAVERGGVAFRSTLAAVVDSMRASKAAGDRKAYLRQDTAFHSCFCEYSGNALMAQTYALYAGKIAAAADAPLAQAAPHRALVLRAPGHARGGGAERRGGGARHPRRAHRAHADDLRVEHPGHRRRRSGGRGARARIDVSQGSGGDCGGAA